MGLIYDIGAQGLPNNLTFVAPAATSHRHPTPLSRMLSPSGCRAAYLRHARLVGFVQISNGPRQFFDLQNVGHHVASDYVVPSASARRAATTDQQVGNIIADSAALESMLPGRCPGWAMPRGTLVAEGVETKAQLHGAPRSPTWPMRAVGTHFSNLSSHPT